MNKRAFLTVPLLIALFAPVAFAELSCGFVIDLSPPVVLPAGLYPPPDTIMEDTDFTVAINLADSGAGVWTDSVGMTIIVNSSDSTFFTGVTAVPGSFSPGDTVEVCVDAIDEIYDTLYCTCPPNELDTCWTFYIAETPCSVWIDSVWFWEETDCNDSNIVHICYTLSSTCPDSVYTVSAQMSADSGVTWTVPLVTLIGAEDAIGDSISPGTHCFDWIMSEDLPNSEALFGAKVTVNSEDTCCYGRPLRDNGSIPEMLLLGDFDGFLTLIDTNRTYLPGEIIAGNTWFTDTTDYNESTFGDPRPGFIWFNTRYGWGLGHCYAQTHICFPSGDTTVYLYTRQDDDIKIWFDGNLVFEEHNLADNMLSSDPVDITPLSLSGCMWHRLRFSVYDRGGNFAISHWIEDGLGNPIEGLHCGVLPGILAEDIT
ncbi:hypothetical protein DRQ36_11345, partial [bacterium]